MTTSQLTRSMLDRILGGVCGGIGGYLGISGWWVRIGFLLLALVNISFALLVYLLLWILIPAQTLMDTPPIVAPGQARTPRYARPEAMLILGLLSVIVGVIVLAQSTGAFQATQGDLLAPAMLFLIGLVVLIKHLRGRP